MQRVVVVGPGGAGKSTYARALGARLGLPVVHLDEHYWKPGWEPAPRDEWRARQVELFAGERWVADGNYTATLDPRLERADTVVFLHPPRVACVASAVRRSLANLGRPVQAAGCPERVDLAFLRWIWEYDRRSRPRLDDALAWYDHLEVVDLPSRAAARRHLASLPLTET